MRIGKYVSRISSREIKMVELLMNSSKESFLIVIIIMLMVGFLEKSLISSLLHHDKMLS